MSVSFHRKTNPGTSIAVIILRDASAQWITGSPKLLIPAKAISFCLADADPAQAQALSISTRPMDLAFLNDGPYVDATHKHHDIARDTSADERWFA